jgi:hypothetical protein
MVALGAISSPTIMAGTSAKINTWDHLGAAEGNKIQVTAGTTVDVGVRKNATVAISAGSDIAVDVTGSLTGSMVTESGDVDVGVLGAISDTTLTAKVGSVDVLAGANATALSITADHTVQSLADDPQDPAVQNVTVTVVGDLIGKIRARHSAEIGTIGGTGEGANPGNTDLNANVSDGALIVTSAGEMDGTYVATGQVTAMSVGPASGTYHSSGSDISVSSVDAIDATIKGAGTATVFAGGTFRGIVWAGASATVTAGGTIEGTITAKTDAEVMTADGTLKGGVTARKGAATVSVGGPLYAVVITGKTQVDVWTEDGFQSGTIQSKAGPVNVTSFGPIADLANIKATGGDATVYGNALVDGLGRE